jgi:SAM-dependent methyltransferase
MVRAYGCHGSESRRVDGSRSAPSRAAARALRLHHVPRFSALCVDRAPAAREHAPVTLDWGLGEYERTARELEPAAHHVVALAGIARGERVLDVACGTGNAAIEAARLGAQVTGLDAAPRLIDVAGARAAAAGVEAAFVVGDAQDLPFDDGAFDCVVSVFGVIFVPDPARAVAEIVRVLAPGGRALVAAWRPEGAVHAMAGVLGRGVAEAGGPRRSPFAWHDPDAVRDLAAEIGPHPPGVEAEDGRLVVEGASPEAYFADAETYHPMAVAARPLLERAGTYPALREEAIAALRAGNEDPDGFRVTSPYRVLRITRPG